MSIFEKLGIENIIKDVMQGLLGLLKHEVQTAVHAEVSKYMDEAIEKSMKKIFIVGVVLSLVATGIFLFSWGIASGIDKIFNMGGLGFMIVGSFGIMIGILIYYMFNKDKLSK